MVDCWNIKLAFIKWSYYTLKYGIMVPSGINVPPGKFGKNNKHTPWKTQTYGMFLKRTLFEVENPSEPIYEVFNIHLVTCLRTIHKWCHSKKMEGAIKTEIWGDSQDINRVIIEDEKSIQ